MYVKLRRLKKVLIEECFSNDAQLEANNFTLKGGLWTYSD